MASQVKKRIADEEEAFFELPRKLNESGGATLCIAACEADGLIEMTAEIPGVPESAIDVSLEGDILTISVEKHDRDKGKRVHFSERSYGRFARSIQLPFAPDPDSIGASVENGLLTISFPRVEAGRKRHIVINGAAPAEAREEDPGAFVYAWADMPEPEPAPVPAAKEGSTTLDVKAVRID